MVLDMRIVKNILDNYPKNLREHSYNVCNLSVGLYKYMGFKHEEIKILAIGALLHDIGKNYIDQDILNKSGKLTNKEFAAIKMHTVIGAEIISAYKDSHKYLPIILYHHERWDGKGYEGLYQNEIPELARIVTLTDAFDAITSYRPYQQPRSITAALNELSNNKGKQFSPELIVAFERYVLNSIKKY